MAGKRKSKTGEVLGGSVVFFRGVHANHLICVTTWTASRAGSFTSFPK